MGLDMYLNAKRAFAPDSLEAENILSAAGVTLDQLQRMAKADPMEGETYLYLGRWSFRTDTEEGRKEVERANAVMEAAGLLAFATPESAGGELAWDPDQGAIVASITAMYWRKANQIHAWFVDECQDGIDECQESEPIHPEKLMQLHAFCKKALEAYKAGDTSTAGSLLPPRQGFFFGGYEIDEWYARDLEATIEGIERVIKLAIQTGGVSFTYHSSW